MIDEDPTFLSFAECQRQAIEDRLLGARYLGIALLRSQ
jgi:hypothetical protein